jgi:hypothetical protein
VNKKQMKRAEATQILVKRSKKTNVEIYCVKTICGLAERGYKRKKAKASMFGAGPKVVQFWPDNSRPIAGAAVLLCWWIVIAACSDRDRNLHSKDAIYGTMMRLPDLLSQNGIRANELT